MYSFSFIRNADGYQHSEMATGHWIQNLHIPYKIKLSAIYIYIYIYTCIYIYYMNFIAFKRNNIFCTMPPKYGQQCLPRRPLGQVCWTWRQLHRLRWIHRVKLRAWQLHRILSAHLQRLLSTLVTSRLTWRHWKWTKKERRYRPEWVKDFPWLLLRDTRWCAVLALLPRKATRSLKVWIIRVLINSLPYYFRCRWLSARLQ